MAVFHTAADPPRTGSRALAASGSIVKSNIAPRKPVAANSGTSPAEEASVAGSYSVWVVKLRYLSARSLLWFGGTDGLVSGAVPDRGSF